MSTYLRDVSVMIVDDQEFQRLVLKQMVRVLGPSDITSISNAEEAWESFKIKPVDLIITDWEFGSGMNGKQFTKLIRKSEDSPNVFVPIIMVTAFRDKGHVFAARDAGVTEYVIKPLSPKALFSRIEAVIERPRRFVRVGEFFGPDRRRHKMEFQGPDRRGDENRAPHKKLSAEAQSAEKKRELGQQEINETFNPDDAPIRESAD